MNAFTALGLAVTAALEPARTILVLSRSNNATNEALRQVARASLAGDAIAPERVDHRNGAAEIRYRDGGRILFRGLHGFRGISADMVFVDDDAVHELRCRSDISHFDRVHDGIRSVVAGNAEAEVIYA